MRFDIQALAPDGEVTTLALEAASPSDAKAEAVNRGYTVLKARRRPDSFRLFSFRPAFPLLLFSQELIALLDAGLSLVETLHTLSRKEPRTEIRRVMEALSKTLSEGRTFSAALEPFPAHFPKLYVETVRAGERTGDVAKGLSRFVAYQSQMEALKKKLITASIYPALVVSVGLLVIAFLAVYVIPKFSLIYTEAGQEVPWTARGLIVFGRFVNAHTPSILLGAAFMGLLVTFALRDLAVREALMQQLWRLPAVGDRLRMYQLARFYRTLGMLVSGGTPFVPALQQASGLLPPVLSGKLVEARRMIEDGRSISFAMERNGLTTPVADSLLQVAERTGSAGEMLDRIATFYDEDLGRWIERVGRLFEPLLMLAIGVIVGVVVLLMYQPIFELAGNLQ